MLREIRNTAITIIAAVAVSVAALAASASSASAALIVRQPATAKPVQVVSAPTAIPLKEAGSAGVPGYDDAKCEGLLHDFTTSMESGNAAQNENNMASAETNWEVAKKAKSQMEENCLVVD